MQARVLEKKANKVEKMKLAKAGHKAWEDVQTLGQLVREGQTKWEDLNLDDVDLRMKWAGLFHRRKRAPGTFMMRLKVPPVTRDTACMSSWSHGKQHADNSLSAQLEGSTVQTKRSLPLASAHVHFRGGGLDHTDLRRSY